MMLEEKINGIIKLLTPSRVVWLVSFTGNDINRDKARVDSLLDFIEQGKDKGFSTFFSYRKSLEIINLVEQNMALALLSPDVFIRILAETLLFRRRNDRNSTNDSETIT